jgi:hypothetical protein
MGFERYIGQRAVMKEPKAAIWKTGQINLNRAFLEKYDVKKTGFALLFFDKDKKKIAFRLIQNGKEPGAAKLSPKATGAMIFAKGFLNHFGIESGKGRRFDIRYDEKDDLFILEGDK